MDTPRQTFRITLVVTDEEIGAYQRIVMKRRPVAGGWGFFAASFGLAILISWLASASGLVEGSYAGLTGMFVFLVFWLGVWSPSLWYWPRSRKALKANIEDIRQRYHVTKINVSSRGIFSRHPNAVGFYGAGAIKAATLERGLVLLWSTAQTVIVFIPERLLQPAERDLLLSFGKTKPRS